jgi:protein-S-isoprenylcysteine O-methyltransferase Ste14
MANGSAIAGGTILSNAEIDRIRSERRGIWRLIFRIRRRRPFLTAVIVLAAPAYTLAADVPVYDLLGDDRSWRFFAPWLLMLGGALVRLWGSGNLRKNQEITDTGIYRAVRHPLYLGSLSFLLAYFLTATSPGVGLVLFTLLVVLVYYPTMLSEEDYLALKFREVAAQKDFAWRLIPDPRRIPEAFATDRFSVQAAYSNLGFRGVWFLLALPAFLRILDWVQVSIG